MSNLGMVTRQHRRTLSGIFLSGIITGCGVVEPVTLATCGAYRILTIPPLRPLISCSKFPAIAEARKVLQQHQQFIQKLKTDNSGFILVDLRELQYCPGKAMIHVEYAGEQDCPAIKQMIGETFFGIPYVLVNG